MFRNKSIKLLILSLGMLFLSLGLNVHGFGQDLKEAKAVKITGSITMDGILDESDWKKTGFPYFLSHYTSGAPMKEKTEFAVLYNENTLYVGVMCHESQMNKLFCHASTDNLSAFQDDCIEIFLSPAESSFDLDLSGEKNYFHFVANASGFRYADALANPGKMVPWKVKTRQYKDCWTAEFAIPFDSLIPRIYNDAYWRLNVTRNEIASEEVSSWMKTPGNFHKPATFGKLSGIELNGKFITFRRSVDPIVPDMKSVADTYDLALAQSYQQDSVVVVPLPVKMTVLGTDFMLNENTRIMIGENVPEGNLQAATELAQEIKDVCGLEVKISRTNDSTGINVANTIFIGEPDKNACIKELVKQHQLTVNAATPGAEGYVIQMTPHQVLVAGSDDAGTYYGVQSLKQLIRQDVKTHQNLVKGANIWDKPFFKERWLHVLIDKTTPVAHGKMIEKIFAKYKYNRMLIEIERGLKWKSHPEVWKPYALDPSEIKGFVENAKKHYIKIVPMVGTFGHSDWMFAKGVNMDFVEDSTHPQCYCPLNPKSYEFVFSILDETIDLFQPDMIHIGHDEHDLFWPFPTHPECHKVGNSQLYYMDTMHIYHYLKLKGIKTMMWADIVQKPTFKWMGPLLPRDIVMVDWHYRNDFEYPSIDFYQDLKFPVIAGTWYRPGNLSRYSVYGAQRNIEGMMYTTWAGFDKNDTIVEREYRQVMGYITQADLAWNPRFDNNQPPKIEPINSMPYYAGKTLRETWYPKDKWMVVDKKGFAVNLQPYLNFSLVDSKENPGFLGYGQGVDYSQLMSESHDHQIHLMDNIHYRLSNIKGIPGAILLKGKGMSLNFPDAVRSIPVNRAAAQLSFLHATVNSTDTGNRIGSYNVNYDDGTKAVIPVIFGKNISAWNSWVAYLSGEAAWCGMTQKNTAAYLMSQKWTNPFPDKTISTIDFVTSNAIVSPILLAITGIE